VCYSSKEAMEVLGALMEFMKVKEASGDTSQGKHKTILNFVDAMISRLRVAMLVHTGSTHSFIEKVVSMSLHCETKVGTCQYKVVNSAMK
jgi:hypothetical protein